MFQKMIILIIPFLAN